MRPPRTIILTFILTASLFLFCRAVSAPPSSYFEYYPAAQTTASSAKPATTQSSHSQSGHDDQRTSPKTIWGSMYYSTPLSLFPPNAAISLTDDNSTSFTARPAAFGPKLATRGLSGQLWVGSGFAEDHLFNTGELGCSDLPGWEQQVGSGTTNKALRAATPRAALPKRDAQSFNQDGNTLLVADGTKLTTPDRKTLPDDITGKVALLMRGGCGFLDKVMWAQRRGAIAVIVGDNQKGGPLIQMFAHGPEVDNVTIPSVFTARTTAQLLSALTQPGSFIEDSLDHHGNAILRVQRRPKFSKGKEQKHSPPVRYSTRSKRSTLGSRIRRRLNQKRQALSQFVQDLGNEKANFRKLINRRAVKDTTSSSAEDDEWIPDHDSWRDNDRTEGLNTAPSRDDFPSEPTDDHEDIFSKLFREEDGGESEASNDQLYSETQDSDDTPDPKPHEGLWVTIAPTDNANPFFDTLLVLVISPLVTLTVVYAMLLLRARIRRRRWRAPKSVVERLPVRTYHTVASTPSLTPRAASPSTSTPTTPLLLENPTRPRPRSRTTTGVPEIESRPASSPVASTPLARTRHGRRSEREKGSVNFSTEWKKYMGRQVECVVCLEEYVDGESQVMSLPCGHEFHVECM